MLVGRRLWADYIKDNNLYTYTKMVRLGVPFYILLY